MSDKPQIKLAEAVVLIDAAFLNFVITDIKGYFEETLRSEEHTSELQSRE